VTATQALTIRGLKKRYRKRVALHGVDLNIDSGDWVALVGPNGAGKTTLLRSVVGLVTPDDGTIEFEGNKIDPSIRRASIGYAPQETALYPTLTPREHLSRFASLLDLDHGTQRERVAEGLSFAQLEDRAHDQVGTLSGGMKRRLNIACAVLNHPRLLLLDEPTTGVDPLSRAAIWAMLRKLREKGAAILHATHRLDEVEFLCKKATILCEGRVLYEGSLDQLRVASGLPAYEIEWGDHDSYDEPSSIQVANTASLNNAIKKLEGKSIDPSCMRVRPTSFEDVFQSLVTGKKTGSATK
jgi:ABC-2 type transport system ATP-binding protein